MPNVFPKNARLRAAPEFQAVFTQGLKYTGVFFRLYFLQQTEQAMPRLGLAVPKKMAPHAVSRNKIKRVCRDFFRQYPHEANGDFVLVAQRQAKTAENAQLRQELSRLFSQINPRVNETQ